MCQRQITWITSKEKKMPELEKRLIKRALGEECNVVTMDVQGVQ